MATPAADPASLARAAIRRHHPRQEPSAVVPHAGICAGGSPGRRGQIVPTRPKGCPYRNRIAGWGDSGHGWIGCRSVFGVSVRGWWGAGGLVSGLVMVLEL